MLIALSRTFISASLLAFAALILIPSFVAAQSDSTLQKSGPIADEQNGIPYVTGGISDTEQAVFADMRADYNLQLTMALDAGNYLSDIPVRVMDAQGNTVLEVTTAGPFLFAQLAPGNYTVEAMHNGNVQQKAVEVGTNGAKDVIFTWSAG